jgi:hypothetical protein
MLYNTAANRIIFDIATSCDSVILQGWRSIAMQRPRFADSYLYSRSETISIDLDDSFQIKAVATNGENRAAQEKDRAETQKKELEAKGEAKLTSCLEDAAQADYQEPRLVGCSYYRPPESEYLTQGTTVYRIYKISSKGSRVVSKGSCYGGAFIEDGGSKQEYITVACVYQRSDEKPENKSSSYYISIYSIETELAVTFTVDCICDDLELRDFKLDLKNQEVVFELLTASEVVRIQDRPFDLKRTENLAPKDRSIAMVRVQYGPDRRYVKHELAARIQ